LTSDLGFHSELVGQSDHPTLKPGQTRQVTITLRNTGARTWVRGAANQQVNLGIPGDDKSSVPLGVGWPSANRVATQLEASVTPGGIGTFTFTVRAPLTPGVYPLHLQAVADGVTWLDDNGLISLITVLGPTDSADKFQIPVQANPGSPSFTSTSSVDPLTATAGSAVNIKASFTSATATSAIVGVEVFAPGATTLAYQKWFDNESFAAGEKRDYAVTWPVPAAATPGGYTVNLRVFSPGWKTLLGAKQSAAQFTVSVPAASTFVPAPTSTVAPNLGPLVTAPPQSTSTTTALPAPTPQFTTSAATGSASVAAGGPMNITASVRSATATTVLVDLEVVAPGVTAPIYQVWYDNQTFAAGETRAYPATWQVPVDSAVGVYNVKVGVYAPGWASLYTQANSAATFSVSAAAAASPTPVPTAAPTPISVPPPVASLIASRGVTKGNGAPLTLPVPANVVNGDVLIVAIECSYGVPDLPAGWTLLRQGVRSPNNYSLTVLRRVASNEPASYTLTFSGGGQGYATMEAFVGVDNATPEDVVSPLASVGSGTTITYPNITTGTDRAWHLLFAGDWAANLETMASPPASYTQRAVNLVVTSYGRTMSPAGSVTGVINTDPAASWVAISIALRPASGSATIAPSPTPAPTVAPTPAPGPVSVVAQLPAPPSTYAIPAGAVQVANSAQLIAALSSTTAHDIVLADGVYDNAVPFVNMSGHRLYAARLLGATLTAGINLAGGQPNGLVRGIAFDVANPAKTASSRIIFTWGTSKGTRVLDSTFNGHAVVASAIYAAQPDGLVVQRVQIRDFTDWGVLGTLNNAQSMLAVPMLLEDVDAINVTRAVPRSGQGMAEACVAVGNTATVRRVRARNCAWMGVLAFDSSRGSLFEDIDVDGGPAAGSPASAGAAGSVGVYIEHFTTNSVFQRMRIGPSLSYGIVCEGTDPAGAAWGGVSSSIDNVIQDSVFETGQVGVLMGWSTTRTTVRRSTFRSQYVSAITDYLGINNSYYGNDYSGILSGAVPVSAVWWR
jgi:hypothetical protein